MKHRVSVVMAVHNGEKFLKDAIDSILNQTYKDFEFIIINDGSTDTTSDIIAEYNDNRIHLLTNPINKGLVYSLNKGIDFATGEYIIRMDADDISDAKRIEEQVKFMDQNPEIGISGTSYITFGDRISSKRRDLEINPAQNKANLAFFPVLAHPSVIMRKSILDIYNLRYREEFKHAEDYGLWIDACFHTKISNLRKPLLKYRVLNNSVTRIADRDLDARFKIHKQLYQRYFRELGVSLSEKDLKIHFVISSNYRYKNHNLFSEQEVEDYFEKLKRVTKTQPNYKYIQRALIKRRLRLAVIDRKIFKSIFYSLKFLVSKC